MIDKEYMPVVAAILNARPVTNVLDTPSGSGWLRGRLNSNIVLDGIDLYDSQPEGYRNFRAADLDHGLPDDLPTYDAVVSCEGLEHIGNPELFLRSAAARRNPRGTIKNTTPNTRYPAPRRPYLTRGFFPGFPSLAGRVKKGTHMHITPWTFAHLYLYLSLTGFTDITLHDVDEPKPRRTYEKLLGMLGKSYNAKRLKTAKSEEERKFWIQANSPQSVYGRRLVVSAIKG
jgi:hypothetical protein